MNIGDVDKEILDVEIDDGDIDDTVFLCSQTVHCVFQLHFSFRGDNTIVPRGKQHFPDNNKHRLRKDEHKKRS